MLKSTEGKRSLVVLGPASLNVGAVCPNSSPRMHCDGGGNELNVPGVWQAGDDTEKRKREKGRRGRFQGRGPAFSEAVMLAGPWVGGSWKGETVRARPTVVLRLRRCWGTRQGWGDRCCLGRGVRLKATQGGQVAFGPSARGLSATSVDTLHFREKALGYINGGIVRDASAPKSLCVRTC